LKKIAEEEERERGGSNGLLWVLGMCGAVNCGDGGKMGPFLLCCATRAALPEPISWGVDGRETVPSCAIPGCALRY